MSDMLGSARETHTDVEKADGAETREGLLDKSKRGVWSLTDRGRDTTLSPNEARQLFLKWVKLFRDERQKQKGAGSASADQPAPLAGQSTSDGHRERLLSLLMSLPPAGFERLCQRPLVSFKVLFQCKRYSKSVSPAQVRDFRGAMQGRADKGIILTTGTFTSEARREASRDGVTPIELVDGQKLLEMFEELELGVRSVTAYELDELFFDEFGRTNLEVP
jgi:restriction system protein